METIGDQLRLNEYLRLTQGMKDASFGRQLLSIPLDHMPMIRRWFPNWDSKDPIERTKVRMDFARDPRSLPYRVTEKI